MTSFFFFFPCDKTWLIEQALSVGQYNLTTVHWPCIYNRISNLPWELFDPTWWRRLTTRPVVRVAWVHTLWLALVGVGSTTETKQSVGLLPTFFMNLGGPSMHVDIQYHTASTISCPPVLIWQCWYHVPHVCNLGTMYMLFFLSIPCMYELCFLPNSNSFSILSCFARVSLLYLILVKLQPVSVMDAYECNDRSSGLRYRHKLACSAIVFVSQYIVLRNTAWLYPNEVSGMNLSSIRVLICSFM